MGKTDKNYFGDTPNPWPGFGGSGEIIKQNSTQRKRPDLFTVGIVMYAVGLAGVFVGLLVNLARHLS